MCKRESKKKMHFPRKLKNLTTVEALQAKDDIYFLLLPQEYGGSLFGSSLRCYTQGPFKGTYIGSENLMTAIGPWVPRRREGGLWRGCFPWQVVPVQVCWIEKSSVCVYVDPKKCAAFWQGKNAWLATHANSIHFSCSICPPVGVMFKVLLKSDAN